MVWEFFWATFDNLLFVIGTFRLSLASTGNAAAFPKKHAIFLPENTRVSRLIGLPPYDPPPSLSFRR
jgi:hypothetical protein